MTTSSHEQDAAARATTLLGFGDPDAARVWFVAPGPVLNYSHPERKRWLDSISPSEHGFIAHPKPGGRAVPTFRAMARIVMGLKGQDVQNFTPETDWYADTEMLGPGDVTLLTSLCPEGNASLDAPDPGDRRKTVLTEFGSWVVNESGRFAAIREVRAYAGNQLTICFPEALHHIHRTCLELDGRPCEVKKPFTIYRQDRVLLAPGLVGRGKPHNVAKKITELVDIINRSRMNPFVHGSEKPDFADRLTDTMLEEG